MPNLPAQLGLIDKLGGRICDLSPHQIDLLVEAVRRREARRRRKAVAWRAYSMRKAVEQKCPGSNALKGIQGAAV